MLSRLTKTGEHFKFSSERGAPQTFPQEFTLTLFVSVYPHINFYLQYTNEIFNGTDKWIAYLFHNRIVN